MTSVPPRPGDPKQVWWVAHWRKAQDYMQPLPFATGQTMTLAASDPLDRVSISSETGPLMLYDGRNVATNGWFVVRTLIPAGKTKDAIVWHIRPSYLPDWVRPPMIAHSQAGYAPNFEKIAIIGLDRRFNAPRTAELLRLGKDGSFHEVFAAPISKPTSWLRYDYAKFNFSAVKQPGLYEIEYAGERSDVFPIAQNVYSHAWQTTLDCFLAVQMDHVSVKDAYHIWHGVPFMDDAVQAPPNTSHFDGYGMGPKTFSPYKPGQHIPGLAVGGWFDAGDYDNDAYGWIATIDNLSLAYTTFHMKWDELSVNEKTREVVMHKPDGIPDAVEQVMHGVLQVLAQIHAVGHPFAEGIQSPYLEDYTSMGDAASIRDDRWAWTTDNPFTDYRTVAALAAAAPVLQGWYDGLSKQSLAAAIQLWNREKAHPSPVPSRVRRFARCVGPEDWPAALELMIATKGGQPYKQRVEQLFPKMLQRIGFQGWTAVRALPYLPPEYRTQFEAALKAYMPQLQRTLAVTPFGVPPSTRAWGNSEQVADFGSEMYFLHEAFPQIVGPQYTLRAANYLLGTHPASSVSYVAGIGTASKLKTYSA
ncbi:MAG: glycoside hydrolase family 9 protein, partial [Gemmataceae bacterium]